MGSFYDSLFTDCYCDQCKYGEYHSDRDQFYCCHPCTSSSFKWKDTDDDAPCTYYEEK